METIYELSISKNYVSNWDVKDAIREILQNAIDEDTNGHEMYIEHSNNVLTIGNMYSKIEQSQLILGNSSKRNDSSAIGSFGEGFKLALVVLLRNGHSVEIKNNDQIWEPYFEYSEKFKTEILKVRTEVLEDFNHLEFNIYSVNDSLYYELIERFPCIKNNYGDVVETSYGQVLLDKKFKGKMFVEGLYIQEDDSFEFGYNFKASEVNLDRDRKAINYYHLKNLTAMSAITAENCNDEIYKKILKGANCDTASIKNVIDYMNEDFAKEFTSKFYSDKELDKDVVVATPELAKELEKDGYETFTANENVTKILASHLGHDDLLTQTKQKIDNKDKDIEAWEEFQDSWLRKALLFMYRILNKLNIEEQQELRNLIFDNNDVTHSSFLRIENEVLESLPDSLCNDFVETKIKELEDGE